MAPGYPLSAKLNHLSLGLGLTLDAAEVEAEAEAEDEEEDGDDNDIDMICSPLKLREDTYGVLDSNIMWRLLV